MVHPAPFLVVVLGPNVDPFILHLFAAARRRSGRWSASRTKAALAAAKARGVKLGGPEAGPGAQRGHWDHLCSGRRSSGQRVADHSWDQEGGATTLREIADALNARAASKRLAVDSATPHC